MLVFCRLRKSFGALILNSKTIQDTLVQKTPLDFGQLVLKMTYTSEDHSHVMLIAEIY